MRKIMTLCLVHQSPKILLGMKKTGFGSGKWNGFGGKVEPNENIENAAIRELKEEAMILAQGIEKYGVLEFEFENNPEIFEVHIFKTTKFNGIPRETNEMKPQWFNVNEIPFEKMWPDDKYWLPLLLKGNKFKGKFLFEKSGNIIKSNLEEVENL